MLLFLVKFMNDDCSDLTILSAEITEVAFTLVIFYCSDMGIPFVSKVTFDSYSNNRIFPPFVDMYFVDNISCNSFCQEKHTLTFQTCMDEKGVKMRQTWL